jgi:hypothetical protein
LATVVPLMVFAKTRQHEQAWWAGAGSPAACEQGASLAILVVGPTQQIYEREWEWRAAAKPPRRARPLGEIQSPNLSRCAAADLRR